MGDLCNPQLASLIESGKLCVRTDPHVYDLSTLGLAHAKCEQNRSDGRIVVRVAEERA